VASEAAVSFGWLLAVCNIAGNRNLLIAGIILASQFESQTSEQFLHCTGQFLVTELTIVQCQMSTRNCPYRQYPMNSKVVLLDFHRRTRVIM
jgi:hypothetical protein